MEKLEKLIEEGKALAEKHSWVKDAHEKVMGKLNAMLAEVPDMGEKPIYFELRRYDGGYGYMNILYARLSFANDAVLEITEEKAESQSVEEKIDFPSVATIRAFGENFEEMIGYFLAQIEKRGEALAPAISVFEKLLAEVRDESTK